MSTRRSASSDRDGLPARPRPPAADARQLPRAAVRRRDLGARGAEGPLRLRAEDAASAASRCWNCTTCWPRRSRTRRRAAGSSTGASRRTTSARSWRRCMRPWLDEMPAEQAGRAPDRRHRDPRSARAASRRRCSPRRSAARDFILPPIPNTLFQRDPSCWIYNGVTCNPMFWPARKPETLLQRAVYKFHPRFKGGDFKIWWGDSDEDFGAATMEGGDVMPIGKGVVLIGMGERTTRQAVVQVARAALQAQGGDAGDRLPDAEEPRGDASRHGVQLLRPRPGHAVPRGRRPDPLLQRLPPDGEGGIEVRADKGHLLDVVQRSARAEASCASSRPAATPTRPSASSGTTATTSWRSSPAWSSPTTATPTPTRCCARPASR